MAMEAESMQRYKAQQAPMMASSTTMMAASTTVKTSTQQQKPRDLTDTLMSQAGPRLGEGVHASGTLRHIFFEYAHVI